jgi:hypothetical protein
MNAVGEIDGNHASVRNPMEILQILESRRKRESTKIHNSCKPRHFVLDFISLLDHIVR